MQPGVFPGEYPHSPVNRINGQAAIDLVHGKKTLDKNHFVLIYHPKCGACHALTAEFKVFAEQVKEDKDDLVIDVVNMSKTDPKAMGAPHYPFMIFIKKGELRTGETNNQVVELKGDRTAKEMTRFFQNNGL